MHYEKKVRNRLNRWTMGSYRTFVRQYAKSQVGKTGIGKKNFAETFSEIFKKENENDSSHILFSFNSESSIENLYGIFAFKVWKTIIVEGSLYKVIKEGLTLIEDKFNLVEESIIQSFMNFLEVTTQSSNIFFPGFNYFL